MSQKQLLYVLGEKVIEAKSFTGESKITEVFRMTATRLTPSS
jgi:hypothetical protein